ncbi:MAG TPA: GDP-mannose 4,6-dehydratase [Aestuariivirga sp.]|nr:GDP-mannose 4,6-dehydratase [Aestuariivirga sp.]
MKKALITGVTGQDGAYLAKFLIERGYKVYGTLRRNSHFETERLEILGIQRAVELVDFELGEISCIQRVIRDVVPDEVYNFAAQSFVGSSWAQPIYVGDVNGLGVVRILESLRNFAPEAKFYQASTSEMFGKVRETPQNENTPFHPRSPYGVAKVYGHFITMNFRESFGMHASCGICFNHESPLRGVEFVTRKITRGLARIKLGDAAPLELGNIDSKRDWGFAGDFVEGIWMMLQQPKPDDYVLATGKVSSVRDFVLYAANALGMNIEWQGQGASERGIDRATGNTILAINEKLYRPAEVDVLCGDFSKARTTLGWEPKVDVRTLAEMMAKSDYDLLKRLK